MELGDDLVELLLGVLGIGGELVGDVAQDCELLVELYRNADEGAIGAEELVDLFGHVESLVLRGYWINFVGVILVLRRNL